VRGLSADHAEYVPKAASLLTMTQVTGACASPLTRRLLCQLGNTCAPDSIMMVHFDTMSVWL
jgi:hypothetical protein